MQVSRCIKNTVVLIGLGSNGAMYATDLQIHYTCAIEDALGIAIHYIIAIQSPQMNFKG